MVGHPLAYGVLWVKATPHNSARTGGKGFFLSRKFENRGILGVFPVFQTARMGEKTRHPAADAIVRCCLKISRALRRRG